MNNNDYEVFMKRIEEAHNEVKTSSQLTIDEVFTSFKKECIGLHEETYVTSNSMMYGVKKTHLMINMTHNHARQLLMFNNLTCQRKLSRNKLNMLKRKSDDGDFHHLIAGICIMKNGIGYMVNGQHSCTHVLETGITTPATVVFYDNVSDKEIVSHIYSQYDTNMERSTLDLSKLKFDALQVNWVPSFGILLNGTLDRYKNNSEFLSSSDLSKSEKMELIPNNMYQSNFLARILLDEDGQFRNNVHHLKKQYITINMLHTLDISESWSLRFWEKVRDGDNLTKDDPRFVLREYLLNKETNMNIFRKKMALYNICTKAWNAFRNNEPLTKLTAYSKKRLHVI